MTKKKKRETVEKTLVILHKVSTYLQKPVPNMFSTLCIIGVVGSVIGVVIQDLITVASSSALQILATVVESSATILGIFFALMLFVFREKSPALKWIFSRGEFLSACATFSLSMFLGIYCMMFIESSGRVGGIVVFFPTYLLLASLLLLFLLFFRSLRT